MHSSDVYDTVGVFTPELVARAVERSALVRSVLARWAMASARFRLSASGAGAGTLLLCAEFDEATRRAVAGSDELARGVRRRELIRALAGVASESQAAAGLAELEARGLCVAGPASCPWVLQELHVPAELRAYAALGGADGVEPATHAEALPAEAPPERIARAIDAVRTLEHELGGAELAVAIRGGPGSGRDTVLAELLAALGVAGLLRATSDLQAAGASLEPELSGAAAVWDARRSDPTPHDEELAARWLARSPTLAIALLDRKQDPPEVKGRRLIVIDADPLDFDERFRSWLGLLQAAPGAVAAGSETPVGARASVLRAGAEAEAAAQRLARRNRCGAGLAARSLRRVAPGASGVVELVSRLELALDALVRPSTQRGLVVERPTVPLSRLIVSETTAAALEQLVLLAELSGELGGSDRRGVKALLAGPSGTGKTLAARALASHLRLPLYRIDLAAVVSKWIGETEKNLSHALEAAEAVGAVLLFDEGDALLAKRGEVTRGTDRYANLEVSYLLQAIESHDGVVIVTTNQKQNIDAAFQRRFDLSIEFGPPAPEARRLLWEQELGAALDGASDGIAELLVVPELSGGHIASAARLARAIAHRRGDDRVTADDVTSAIAAELRKLGSSVQASNFASRIKRNA